MKYYELDNILAKNAHINFIIGERSNGKTTAVLRHIVKDYYETGRRGMIVRQMEEDIKGFRATALFAAINNGMVEELTNDEYHAVKCFRRSYYLGKLNDDGEMVYEKEPFAQLVSLSQADHNKSISFPNVGTIMFDEFMRQGGQMLTDELKKFDSIISTIVREKDMATIFLVANTVSWNSPYFRKYKIKNVRRMKQGEIAVVEIPSHNPLVADTRVAIEYCESTAKYGGKASDVYFPSDDEQAKMIKEGGFAVPAYPKCPHHFTSANVKLTCWVLCEDAILRCRLLKVERDLFFFVDRLVTIHTLPGEKVGVETPDWERYEFLRNKRRDVVYSLAFTSERSHFTDPTTVYSDRRTQWIAGALRANRVFFEDSEAGEELMYYISQARQRSITSL